MRAVNSLKTLVFNDSTFDTLECSFDYNTIDGITVAFSGGWYIINNRCDTIASTMLVNEEEVKKFKIIPSLRKDTIVNVGEKMYGYNGTNFVSISDECGVKKIGVLECPYTPTKIHYIDDQVKIWSSRIRYLDDLYIQTGDNKPVKVMSYAPFNFVLKLNDQFYLGNSDINGIFICKFDIKTLVIDKERMYFINSFVDQNDVKYDMSHINALGKMIYYKNDSGPVYNTYIFNLETELDKLLNKNNEALDSCLTVFNDLHSLEMIDIVFFGTKIRVVIEYPKDNLKFFSLELSSKNKSARK